MAALNTNIYPAWNTLFASGGYGKPVILYEGGYEVTNPTSAVCTNLSIDPSYCGNTGKIANLITAYKNNGRFRQATYDLFQQFMAQPSSLYPAWYFCCSGISPVLPWQMYSGDLYSLPFQSFNGMADFNTRR